MGRLSQDDWLEKHPYLRPIADFHAQVVAANCISTGTAIIPAWGRYAEDFEIGIPLMRSSHLSINLQPAQTMLVSLIRNLSLKPLPEKFVAETRALDAQLRSEFDAPGRAIGWLLSNNDFDTPHPGLLRYFGWAVLSRYLNPLVKAFAKWRDEDRWLRSWCPTCGSGPSMSQLVGVDPGRERFLFCGCCGSRWRFRRMGCPFCEAGNDHRRTVLAIDGEQQLRIDYCESCSGYLKTYNGEGREALMLADWTSLHLDLVAGDHGLKRLASSLYEL